MIEDCTPELMRDFFWDDEFRMQSQWDDMLADASILEDCPQTGTQVVRWVRNVSATALFLQACTVILRKRLTVAV